MIRLFTVLIFSSIIYFWTPSICVTSDRLQTQNGFTKNNSAVYFKGKPIKDSDPSSFILLDSRYAKDSNQVYYLSHSGDPNVYKDKLLGELHGMLFPKYKLKTIENADPDTFISLPYDSGVAIWALDKNNVYWCGILFDDADVGSFEIINGPGLFAKDKLQFYDSRGYWPTTLHDLPKPKTPSMYKHKDDK